MMYLLGFFLFAGFMVCVCAVILFHHDHEMDKTGRRIFAVYGKPNLPDNAMPVESIGDEAYCPGCDRFFIVHDPSFRFAERISELEIR